ncbi:plasmid replication protein RepC [Methylocystis sp. IM3]|uniref:plasmid replication protein RepC n=1 Tax=unclassified Methylocystis TaxID=2625913 RepID=UPI0031199ABB
MQTSITTPFGRRRLTRAMIARQSATRDFIEAPGASEAVAHKWRLFRAVTEAKAALGVSDRALSVLHALLSFHQETMLTLPATPAGAAAVGIIVFPSNRELSIRAHGMAPATLRRHLASLVEAGLIIRRDSPNGKRFARKGQGGEIEDAYGFDLAPLLARSAEIEQRAEAARAEARAMALLREKITLARRDIAKMTALGMEEGVAADWEALQRAYQPFADHPLRTLSRAETERLAADLANHAANIRNLLEDRAKLQKKSASESHDERHIQNQTTKLSDLEPRLREGGGRGPEPAGREKPPASALDAGPFAVAKGTGAGAGARAYPLGMVLEACPDVVDYARGGEISSWRDLAATAVTVRSALGVSSDAWSQAIEVLGEHDAAVVMAAILQRGDEIKSAGGYLRALTAKARVGAFSLGPVLMALLRGKAANAGRTGKAAERSGSRAIGADRAAQVFRPDPSGF